MGKNTLHYTIPVLFIVILTLTIGGCNSNATSTSEVIVTLPPVSDISPIPEVLLPPQTLSPTATPAATTAIGTTPVVTTPPQTPAQIINDISTADAYALIKANKDNPDFIIVDVRTPDEYSQGHIENAILVDYRAANFREEINKLDRNKEYLIYCRTANRSSYARDIMKELGFMDINHILGGITDWIAQGYPVVK